MLQERLTSAPNEAERLSREAVRQGADVVVAVGGDGTINEVVNGFFEAGKPVQPDASLQPALAVMPLGTGSDFIKSFGWDTSVESACSRLVRHATQPLDVVLVASTSPDSSQRQRVFVNVASCGVSSIAARSAQYYKFLGATLCYQLSAVHGLLRWRNAPCRISIDGGDWVRLPLVTDISIGNGQYYGGGMKIVPMADPGDGLLHIVALNDFNLFDFARYKGMLTAGTHTRLPGVNVFEGRHIQIELDNPDSSQQRLLFELDGEVGGFGPADIRILPSALNLVC